MGAVLLMLVTWHVFKVHQAPSEEPVGNDLKHGAQVQSSLAPVWASSTV